MQTRFLVIKSNSDRQFVEDITNIENFHTRDSSISTTDNNIKKKMFVKRIARHFKNNEHKA